MSRKITTEEFIERAKKVHGDKYDYSKSEYVNSNDKICIICPDHGEFWQRTYNHTSGCGCPKCSYKSAWSKKKPTTDDFIERSKSIHGNRYDYGKSVYINSKTDIEIVCSIHGSFYQTSGNHYAGKGCPLCAKDLIAAKNLSNTDEFVKKARKIHGYKYDYSNVDYITAKTKVEITCKYHGGFFQTPSDHLHGYGCLKCANERKSPVTRTGFALSVQNNTGEATLYLIKCFDNNEQFFKIGITGKTIFDRFKRKQDMPYSYEVINKIVSIDSDLIYSIEKNIKRMLRGYDYSPSIKFGGHTECYDLSKLDYINDFYNNQQ